MPPPPLTLKLAKREIHLLVLDLAVLGLALASAILLVASVTVAPTADETTWVRSIDYAAVGVFGLLLVGKALASGAPLRYTRHHWFDVIGLLPVTHPVFGLDRWWTLIAVLIVLARASAALDRAFGERVLFAVFARYRAAIVEELSEPILIRLLVIIREALAKGSYMESIGKRVDARRPEIHDVVRRAVASSPKLTLAAKLPGADRFVRETVDEAVTAAVVALTSEELNSIVREALTGAIADLELKVAEPSWKERGYSIGDVARGLTRGA